MIFTVTQENIEALERIFHGRTYYVGETADTDDVFIIPNFIQNGDLEVLQAIDPARWDYYLRTGSTNPYRLDEIYGNGVHVPKAKPKARRFHVVEPMQLPG